VGNSSSRGRWGQKSVTNRHRDALSQISWQDFERLVAGYFRDEGYEVDECGTGASSARFDGGVDLRMRKNAERIVVQCKHQNAYQVPHNDVHQLIGIKVNEGASGAIVVSSGEFTPAALNAAKQGHVQLIDGVELRRRLGTRLDKLEPPGVNPSRPAELEWNSVELRDLPGSRNRRRDVRRGGEGSQLVVAGLVVLFVLFLLPRCMRSSSITTTPPRAGNVQASLPSPPVMGEHDSALQSPSTILWPPGQPQAVAAPARPDDPLRSSSVATATQQRALSAAEIARRDAEVQQYLERVPKVTNYRYSPLDQNLNPPTVDEKRPDRTDP
jgi:restriction system protein